MIQGVPQDRQITDAVVLVPGIMGSELVDDSNAVVWGMKLSMTRAFLSRVYKGVSVTDEELDGKPRLRPSRLITQTGVLSLLGAQGPYTYLEAALTKAAVSAAAVKPFPYDWRLSIEYNAKLLIEFAATHLGQWKDTLARLVTASDGPLRQLDVDSVRLSIVAHSMGGLIAHRACQDARLAGSVRTIVSLGTPYHGSAKTVTVLSTGRVAKLVDKEAARRLAISCPGFYDLLPRNACFRRNGTWDHLKPEDIQAMGGDRYLADQAIGRFANTNPKARLAGVTTVPIEGYTQPTATTVKATPGGKWVTEAVDWQGYQTYGDGTVPNLPLPADATSHLHVGSHEGLPSTPEIIPVVIRHLLGLPDAPVGLAPPRELGLTVSEDAGPGKVVVRINELGVTSPRGRNGITVRSAKETEQGSWSMPVTWSFDGAAQDDLLFSRNLEPGLYRITATGGGSTGIQVTTAVLTDG